VAVLVYGIQQLLQTGQLHQVEQVEHLYLMQVLKLYLMETQAAAT
jgi:hypothetical protein